MKLSHSHIALFLSALSISLIAPASIAQSAAAPRITGTWHGFATVRGTQVPIAISISGSGDKLKAAFLNGPAAQLDEVPASSVKLEGGHLAATFDYFARTLDATLSGDSLLGTYGPTHSTGKSAAPISFTETRVTKPTDPIAAPGAPDISGSWEIATKSSKGESAWEFRVDLPTGKSPVIKTVIQRIDGDTGGLWGTWNGTNFAVEGLL